MYRVLYALASVDGCLAATLDSGQREGQEFLDPLATLGFVR
jgi:hypothetical protein